MIDSHAPRRNNREAARPGGYRGNIPGRAPKYDLLIAAIFGAILSYIWRVQDLTPILRVVQYPTLISLAVLGLYLLHATGRRDMRLAWRSDALKAAVAVFAFAVFSGPFSLIQGGSFWFIVRDFVKTIILMLILAAAIRHVADARRLALAIVVGAFFYSFYVETQISIGMGGRLGNLIMYDANDLGAILICTIPLTIMFVFQGRKWWSKAAAVGVLGLFLRTIIRSGSRGAFLGLIALGLYFLFGFRAVRARTRTVIIAVGVAFMLIAGSDQYWSMMETILHPTEDYNWSGDVEGSGRMDVWTRGIGYMLSDPLTGVGARAFPVAEGTISSIADRQDYGIGVKWSAAHNSFVQVGAETGLGGLIALVAMVWLTIRNSWRIGRRFKGSRNRHLADASWLGFALVGAMVGFVVSGSFVSHAYLPHLYLLVGIGAGLSKVVPRSTTPDRSRAMAEKRSMSHPGSWTRMHASIRSKPGG